MKNILHFAKAAAATVALLAVVVYGGRIITTGSVSAIEPEYATVVKMEEPKTQLASADDTPAEPEVFVPTAKAGKRVAGKCKACHSFTQGDTARKTGPNLWGVMGRDIAHVEGFNYSPAFEAKKGEIVWDAASIEAYVTKPRDYIPGNKMAFAGLRKEEDRKNLIAYLETLK